MFQKMFKAPNVPNFTAKEKFEREKRKERIYERDKFEKQIIDRQMRVICVEQLKLSLRQGITNCNQSQLNILYFSTWSRFSKGCVLLY
jgi:hypothetical protein